VSAPKIVGIVPARMAASRFPGKPLHPICGRPMLEHAYCRAAMFDRWDGLYLATCDEPIAALGRSKGWPTIMTSHAHPRALDRVAEAAATCGRTLAGDDIVVCVQADEPMLHPDMIAAALQPLLDDRTALCTLLGIEVRDEELWRNPDTVKVVHDQAGNVVYTSRAPVPYAKTGLPTHVVPRRVGGIFAFQFDFLQMFTRLPESPLELAESCDSNRIFDNGYRQKIAPYPYRVSYSVDSPADTQAVEAHIRNDELWGKY
jgi:3-deoxy-manno-octulosonate cytidylyltransferase (CMP-KDO synthetase)